MTADAAEEILNEELKGYKALLSLLQRERVCLLGFDTESYEAISKEKDTLVFRLRLLDEERQRVMSRLFGGEMNLKRIAEATGNARLLEIRSTFLSLLQGVEELNNLNRMLIDRSLNYLRGTARFLSSAGIPGPREKGALYSGEV